jgi:hypothetical protein
MERLVKVKKKRIVAVTFILLFGMFCFFSLMDLRKRMLDYGYFTTKINAIIKRAYASETSFMSLRLSNYLGAKLRDKDIASVVARKDTAGLKKFIDPLYGDLGLRFIPVVAATVYDRQGAVLYQKRNAALAVHADNVTPPTVASALVDRKPVSGFEADAMSLHYSISVPIVKDVSSPAVGVVEVAINPAWFHFKLRWELDNVKVAIISKDKVLVPNETYSYLRHEHLLANQEQILHDNLFFQAILDRINLRYETMNLKTGTGYYLISTTPMLLSHDNKEMGRILVAYDMTEFRERQWGYFYVWILFFSMTAGIMFLISFIGFRKYERIITEQGKKLAHRSKQCALGEMLSYIGHQWRQPLHTLSLAIQNIELQSRLGHLDSNLLEKQVALANKNIDYLTQVIEDWRSLLMSGTTRQVIDLGASVKRAIGIVAPALESCHIQVENRISGSFKTYGFVNDLVQLTVNVLLNARDALTDHQGERLICIDSSADGGIVTVSFQDNGGGIPKEMLEKVFEAYLTTKEEAKGTGLGLYLCRQIAENLDDGKVWAENRAFEFNGTRYVGACILLQFKYINEGERREC